VEWSEQGSINTSDAALESFFPGVFFIGPTVRAIPFIEGSFGGFEQQPCLLEMGSTTLKDIRHFD
jgi:hypothetical protein